MSAVGAVLSPVLLAVAIVVWPRSGRVSIPSRTTNGDSGGGLGGVRSAGKGSRGLHSGGTVLPGRVLGRWRALWHEDPVELLRSWKLRRRPGSLVDSVLALLDGIRPALEVGLTPRRALEVASASVLAAESSDGSWRPRDRSARGGSRDLAPLVADLIDSEERGQAVSAVWGEWAQRSGSAELGFVAAAWRLSETTGAPLAAAVERAAQGLRDSRARRGKVAVAVAGPRATVTVLSVLPLTGPIFGLACGVDPLTLYAASPIATVSLLLGLRSSRSGAPGAPGSFAPRWRREQRIVGFRRGGRAARGRVRAAPAAESGLTTGRARCGRRLRGGGGGRTGRRRPDQQRA